MSTKLNAEAARVLCPAFYLSIKKAASLYQILPALISSNCRAAFASDALRCQ